MHKFIFEGVIYTEETGEKFLLADSMNYVVTDIFKLLREILKKGKKVRITIEEIDA